MAFLSDSFSIKSAYESQMPNVFYFDADIGRYSGPEGLAMATFERTGAAPSTIFVGIVVNSQNAGAVVSQLADLELSNSPQSEDRNSGQQMRVGKKQLEQSIEQILAEKLLESGEIRDVRVAAYQMEGSCRKAADYLTAQGIKSSKSSIARAVERAGGVSAVMSAKKTMRRDFIE